MEFILLIVSTKPHTLHGCEYVLSDTIIRQNTYANGNISVGKSAAVSLRISCQCTQYLLYGQKVSCCLNAWRQIIL